MKTEHRTLNLEPRTSNLEPRNARFGWVMAVMGILLAGCGTFTVKPGADPVVVYAEYSAELALNVFDSFLKWERDNDAALRRVAPGIHQTANEIRDNGKRWIEELRTATKAYKAGRTTGNRNAVLMAQQFLELAVAEVRSSIAKGGGI